MCSSDLTLSLGFRFIRDESAAPILDTTWRFSEKYSVNMLESYDFRQNSNRLRILFNRWSPDHVWSFGVSIRDAGDDFGIELTLHPSLGGVGAPTAFEDVPGLDPLGAFP